MAPAAQRGLAVLFCLLLSPCFSIFLPNDLHSLMEVIDCVCSAFSLENGSDNFQVFYMSELKLEIDITHFKFYFVSVLFLSVQFELYSNHCIA